MVLVYGSDSLGNTLMGLISNKGERDVRGMSHLLVSDDDGSRAAHLYRSYWSCMVRKTDLENILSDIDLADNEPGDSVRC